MSTFDPPPDFYVRWAMLRLIRSEPAALPLEPESEPTNVHSIDAARTRRATELVLRRRAAL
jgi:hypothetical protein